MNHAHLHRTATRPLAITALSAAFALALCPLSAAAQQAAPQTAKTDAPPQTHYVPSPAFDTSSIDPKADPCNDFYKFACGNFAANHPIPPDQSGVDQFYLLYNVNTQELNGILKKYTAADPSRTPNEQKIGDYYAACMNTDLIEQKGLAPIQPLLDAIDKVSKQGLTYFAGELQRYGVNVFFGFGEIQDFKDSSKQVAFIDQGGLGLPERDYYTRTGDKDKTLRDQYVEHITKVLTFAGETPQQAALDAKNILAFETILAEASMTNTERRDPEAIYHPQTVAAFESSVDNVPFGPFFTAIHSPHIDSLVNGNPDFFPKMADAVRNTDMQTLRAYMRFHLLDSVSSNLPKRFDEENFDFYGRKLEGQPEQRPRWKRCSSGVDNSLGEALGQVYVSQYFAGDSKAKTLEMVHDIESAMEHDLDTLEWMSPETKVRAKEKLHAVADKIGYPEHWRDYSKLTVAPDDAFGNAQRATAFENDRELNKIGQPVDKLEWGMTPPTVNAYYDPSMNNINFPAGILQPAFYDPKADVAVNYGHIGAVIGHELTHGFDDQGRKFDAKGNMTDWWTADDTKKFESRTGCLVNEYGSFTAVDDVKVNGKLTLGENTADNGGLVLAYMAYLARAKKDGFDIDKKIDGYNGPQRFYIAFAQNWCENPRPEQVRQQVLTNEHSPDHFRANGAIVNQPGFGPAFGCKKGSAMVPADACRVW
ncbi:M13 family metallopeptidase [Granulicella sp. S156]|uniref:M13 family metallopeptidase n=1 Tax=Granulicella sp. S156 TaxID=1747224 RepID=UPI00131E9E14|nr:M13 family metallopeptidase [Granulicella sp. S156]